MKKSILFFALFWQAHTLYSAVNSSWTGATNANWSNAGNWTAGVPTSAGDTANLANAGSSPTSARSVTLDADETITTLNIDNSGAYTLSGGSTLFLATSAGTTPTINVTDANGTAAHTVSCILSLTNNLTINQNASGTAGTFTIGAGGIAGVGSLTVAGTGIVFLQGANSFTGGTILSSGTLEITTDGALGNAAIALTLSGGTLQAGATFSSARNITITEPATIDTQGFTLTLSGVISGSDSTDSLTKVGSGVLVLTGTNTYTGGTTISVGTLQINAQAALGSSGTTLTIAGATLQAAGGNFSISNHPISLTGSATIDPQTNTLTISSVISNAGSLTIIGSGAGKVVLSGANTYTGDTTISSGILSVANDGNLGNSFGDLSIGSATLLINTNGFSSARSISLTGSPSIFDTGGFSSNTLSGSISGSGSLTVQGGGTLILSGSSNYTGGTNITASSTLQGNTNSLSDTGTITINAGSTLKIEQSFDGTFGGNLSGTGTLSINPAGNTGAVTMTADSHSAYSGAVQIHNGSLIMDGSVSNSTVAISSGATLGGTGSVGATTSTGGILSPGDPTGTLSIQGTLTLNSASTALINITPTTSGKIAVSSTANLANATVSINPASGFYPPTLSYTILTSNGLGGTTFNASPTSNNSNFVPTLSYTTTDVLLSIRVLNPFFGFPFSNRNTASVGNNLGALNTANILSPQLTAILNSFVGGSDDAINAALDQMHPAPFSAYSEWQEEMGAQLISLFHRKPTLQCGCCCEPNRLWIKPFGASLTEKHHGEEFGFTANSGGIALGYDREVGDDWVIGLGGAWNNTHLDWHANHGHGVLNGLYGALYTDYQIWNFYFGGSVMAGADFFDTSRHLDFFTTDEHAHSSYTGIDVVAQFSSAYYFGAPMALLYPYANFDFLYLHTPSFQEEGAPGLNLTVDARSDSTFRTEMGLAFQIQDSNYDETLCISPLVSIGWVNMTPISRPNFHSHFEGAPISFTTYGWDHTWNLLALSFNLYVDYRCFKFGLEYNLEMSCDEKSLLSNQNGDFRFDWKF